MVMGMRTIGLTVWLLALAGCGETAGRREPVDERRRDSTIGASQLPGAQGVRGALRTADSAAARRSREDSIAAEPGP
jgi:hypothetical protein